MKEIIGNLWDYKNKGYIVIPTNGTININGECVMGRGVALQAKLMFPGVTKAFPISGERHRLSIKVMSRTYSQDLELEVWVEDNFLMCEPCQIFALEGR